MLEDKRFPIKAKLFRGLADLSRLKILEVLRAGPKCVSELVTLTGLSQPNVSAHLSCLTECGLVTSTPEGRRVYYRLAHGNVETLLALADIVLDNCQAGIVSCPNYEANADSERVTNPSDQAAQVTKMAKSEGNEEHD